MWCPITCLRYAGRISRCAEPPPRSSSVQPRTTRTGPRRRSSGSSTPSCPTRARGRKKTSQQGCRRRTTGSSRVDGRTSATGPGLREPVGSSRSCQASASPRPPAVGPKSYHSTLHGVLQRAPRDPRAPAGCFSPRRVQRQRACAGPWPSCSSLPWHWPGGRQRAIHSSYQDHRRKLGRLLAFAVLVYLMDMVLWSPPRPNGAPAEHCGSLLSHLGWVCRFAGVCAARRSRGRGQRIWPEAAAAARCTARHGRPKCCRGSPVRPL